MSLGRHSFTVAIAAFLAAAAFAQPDLDASADRQRQLTDTIEQAESRGGPYSEDLLAPLASLAMLHQEAGDRALASAVTERMLHIVRVNRGLHSLDQAPLLAQLIANDQAADNSKSAWALQDDLLALAKRNPEDLRTVAIFREVADQRLALLGGGKLPLQSLCRGNELLPGCNNAPPSTEFKVYTGTVRGLVFADAMNNWANAIGVLLRNEMYGSPELRELEEQLIKWGTCDVARDSYRRLMAYDTASGETWLKRAATIVHAADSELVCAQARPSLQNAALALYREAYDMLVQNGVARTSIDEVFSPEVPIKLSRSPPAEAYPMSSGPAAGSEGHIDVAFEITADGRARRVEIVAATANVPDDQRKRAVELTRTGLYRPRAANGAIGDRAPVVWRYYW